MICSYLYDCSISIYLSNNNLQSLQYNQKKFYVNLLFYKHAKYGDKNL